MKMKKYAKKYALKRDTLGFNKTKVEDKMIIIDMATGDDVIEEETVQVVSNSTEKEKKITVEAPLPETQVVQIEEPPVVERMAVHKLAKELNLKSSKLVELINSEALDFMVKSHMSFVTADQIGDIKNLLESE